MTNVTFCSVYYKYMIKVTDAVLELIQADELATETLRMGLLNLSAYADKIRKNVENLTYKDVKKGTIVVALSRIKKDLPKTPLLSPEIQINNLSVKSSLCVYTYEKTADIQRRIAVLHPFLLPMNDLFSVTEGQSEVTIIFAHKSKELIEKHFQTKTKSKYENVVSVSVQFASKYANQPNFLYGLLRSLATKRINLIEVVSTFTELSFVVTKEDMETTMKVLNAFFVKKKTK